MQLLDFPSELLLVVAENLSVKDLSHFLRASRSLSCLLTPLFHKLAVQDVGPLTALQWAATHGHAPLAELVLSRSAGVPVDSTWKALFQNPLHIAAAHNHPDVIRVLANHGESIVAGDSKLSTPLHAAAGQGSLQAIRALLELGADMTHKNGWGRAPVHISAGRGDIDSMGAFIDAGFDFYLRGYHGWTVLHEAIRSGKRMVEFLLKHGGKKIINTQDCSGKTPLHWAVCGVTADDEVAKLLCQHGASTKVGDNRGYTPMTLAIISRRASLRALLETWSVR